MNELFNDNTNDEMANFSYLAQKQKRKKSLRKRKRSPKSTKRAQKYVQESTPELTPTITQDIYQKTQAKPVKKEFKEDNNRPSLQEQISLYQNIGTGKSKEKGPENKNVYNIEKAADLIREAANANESDSDSGADEANGKSGTGQDNKSDNQSERRDSKMLT